MRRDGCGNLSQMDLFHPETWTSATSATLPPTICAPTTNCISSPASAAGRLPCAPPDGPTIDQSGPAPVPASLSARQAKAAGLMTSGTYGRPGSGSSSSVALAELLGSRLTALTAGCGSTLYRLTWKRAATRSGRWYFLLRASAPRTSGTAATGWPTPNAGPQNDSDTKWEARREICKERHGNNGFGLTLGMASQLAGWPTPKAEDAESTGFSAKPLVAGKIPDNLHSASKLLLGGWATPSVGDYRTPPHQTRSQRDGSPAGECLEAQAAHVIPGASLNGSPAQTVGAGLLNPRMSLWLQGYPATLLDVMPTVKPKRRK